MLLSAGTLVIPYGSQKETPGTGVKSLISRVLGRFNFIKIITEFDREMVAGSWPFLVIAAGPVHLYFGSFPGFW